MGTEVLGSLLSDITSIVCGFVITPRLIMGLADADHENDILWIVRTQAQSLIEMFERTFGVTSQCKGISEKSMRSREVRSRIRTAFASRSTSFQARATWRKA